MQFDRRTFLSALAALGVPGLTGLAPGAALAQTPTGAPIKIGGTLAL
ncbi:MAG: hypothetical protein JWQ73_3989, partial [Variovorax sp.]|nr:hypothetical protein [Variovorax sp.]